MANQQVGNIHGVAAVAAGSGTEKTNLTGDSDGNPQTGYADADLLTIQAMKDRLAVIDPGFYTADRLNTMTVNDMKYAIRVNDNPTTVKQ